METWYAIVERKTGMLLSTGTKVELDRLPSYVDVQVLDREPLDTEYWSVADRFFKPRAPKVEVSMSDLILDDMRAMSLTELQQSTLRTVLQQRGVR